MEIGSEFNLRIENLAYQQDNLLKYFDDVHYILFNSGRAAIRQLYVALNKNGLVLLPEYLCESVVSCFPKDKIIYYKLTKELQIDLDDIERKISNNISVLYIVNYFAIKPDCEIFLQIRKLKEKYAFIIIEDTTHSLFSNKITIGDFAIASLRKWFPIPDGGVLYSNNLLSDVLVEGLSKNKSVYKFYGMILKTLFLDNVLDCNMAYRKLFEDGEKSFSNVPNSLISNFSSYLLECFNVPEMLQKREKNFFYLKKFLEIMGIKCAFDKIDTTAPFVLPILCEKRDFFRAYLSQNKIYCAIHWPLNYDLFLQDKSLVNYFSNNLISLPIDQRYEEKEMQYIIDVIKNYKGNV